MNNIPNTMLLLLIWVIYLSSFYQYIRRQRISMNMGLNVGIMHMVLIPLTVFAAEGELAGDPNGLVPGADWAINGPAILKVLGMVGLYGLWDLVRHGFPASQPAPSRTHAGVWASLPKLGVYHLIVIFFVMAIALFVLTGISSGGHWADAKAEYLQGGGTPAVLSLNIFAAVRVATLVAMASLFWHERVTMKWLLLWLGPICVVDLYTTGNRIFTLQVVVVLTAILLLRGRWVQLGILSLLAIPFGILMTIFPLIRVYMHRWSGGFQLSTASSALSEGYTEAKDYFLPDLGIAEFFIGITEGRNMNALVIVVQEFHTTVGMLMGTGILRGFVFWIPRSIWPGKPENLTVLIGQHLFAGGERGVSMGATIIGEFWANFGFFGFAMMPVVFYIINFAFKTLIRDATMRSIAAFIFGYSVCRMPVSDFSVLFLFVIFVINLTTIKVEGEPLRAS